MLVTWFSRPLTVSALPAPPVPPCFAGGIVLRNNQTQEVTYLPVGGLFFAIGEPPLAPVVAVADVTAQLQEAMQAGAPACHLLFSPAQLPSCALLQATPRPPPSWAASWSWTAMATS